MSEYPFDVSLSVIEDLGRNLYTSVPAVLSELVANAFDADATEVRITIAGENVSIIDDGVGMDKADVQSRYLTVGYKRRLAGAAKSPSGKRDVMGRKGIGKLAVFAISDKVLVTTRKGGAEPIAIELDYQKIADTIRSNSTEKYTADLATPRSLLSDHGTRLDLAVNKRMTGLTGEHIRRRIARRFHAIGSSFRVFVNDEEVTADDRDLWPKAEFIWIYGDIGVNDDEFREQFPLIKAIERRSDDLGAGRTVKGWIASTWEPKVLKEADDNSLNRIPLFTRKKLAHEDLLKHSTDARVYTKYLFGELDAEFLDDDKLDDIATSSRQSFKEDDPRFATMVGFLKSELQHIRESWSENRVAEVIKFANSIDDLRAWTVGLSPDDKRKFGQLLDRIAKFGMPSAKTAELVKFSVVAFETLRLKGNLTALENMDFNDLAQWAPLFASLDAFESACYLQVTLPRLEAIEKLKLLVDEDVLEKFLQQYIAEQLWLLDPTWDPIAEAPIVERDMHTVVNGLKKAGDAEDRSGRVDIKYAKTSFGKHVVIELKRSSVRTSVGKLYDQAEKYLGAVRAKLDELGRPTEQVEIIILVGDLPKGTDRQKAAATLGQVNARILCYKQLLTNAEDTYREYIKASGRASALVGVLNSIDEFFKPSDD